MVTLFVILVGILAILIGLGIIYVLINIAGFLLPVLLLGFGLMFLIGLCVFNDAYWIFKTIKKLLNSFKKRDQEL